MRKPTVVEGQITRLSGRKAAILVELSGRVVAYTEAGAALCHGKSLFRITAQGTLAAATAAWQTSLTRAIQNMSRCLLRLPANGGREFVVVCAPAGEATGGGQRLLLTVMDSKVEPQLQEVAALYGLTRAEMRLTEALLACGSLDGAMKKLNVTRNTVRSQMTAIFRKTGTCRQGELVRLLTMLEIFAQMCDDI